MADERSACGCGLSWALVVATCDRAAILETCIALAVGQSRPPCEVIVVDASATWASTRAAVLGRFAAAHPQIRWEMHKAEAPSLARQRNQGIALATADILFLIDDDSLMYPGCAGRIMAIYEADRDGAVAGVQATLAAAPPGDLEVADGRKKTGYGAVPEVRGGRLRTVKEALWRHLFLMDAPTLFIPYDGAYPRRPLPSAIARLGVVREDLLHGCRMTFRRRVVTQEPFAALLLSYCPGEDLDLSYRASRHGLLLTAGDAILHHHQTASGRIDRFRVTLLSALNQAALLRLHAHDLALGRRRYRALMRRRLLAEFLKDVLSRRWTLPQLRGLGAALGPSSRIFAMAEEELRRWYPACQRDVLNGRPPLAP